MAGLRLFVAVEIPQEIRKVLSAIIEKISSVGGVKWVEIENTHLTLLFLGEQEEASLPAIVDSLRMAAKPLISFQIKLGGFGAFPNFRNPKTFFVPVKEGEKSLENLVERLSVALQERKISFGLKPFHGHVTLGRSKTLKGLPVVLDSLSGSLPELLGEMNVQHFVLFQSRLTEKGPIYTALEKFKIGA